MPCPSVFWRESSESLAHDRILSPWIHLNRIRKAGTTGTACAFLKIHPAMRRNHGMWSLSRFCQRHCKPRTARYRFTIPNHGSGHWRPRKTRPSLSRKINSPHRTKLKWMSGELSVMHDGPTPSLSCSLFSIGAATFHLPPLTPQVAVFGLVCGRDERNSTGCAMNNAAPSRAVLGCHHCQCRQ